MELFYLKTGALNRVRQPRPLQFKKDIFGETAYVEYHQQGNEIVLTYCFVPPLYRNQGNGAKLVKKCLDHFSSRGHDIVPICSFIQHFIDENPQYHHYVARWTE